MYNGFANRRLRPLGYAANSKAYVIYPESAGFAIIFIVIFAAGRLIMCAG